nr:MAG TPA: hypothetical protein [Herelleviridae sp.]
MLDRRFCEFNCKFKGTSYWAFPNYLEDYRIHINSGNLLLFS